MRGKKARQLLIRNFYRERAVQMGRRDSSWRLKVEQLANAGKDSRAILCSKRTQLFSSTAADRGWACGYRNCQMLISGIEALGQDVPTVRQLQELLERAWSAGFDPAGAEQLKHARPGVWVGTTEIYCMLGVLGVKSHIVDFHQPTGPRGSHPALVSWIVDYFTAPDTVHPPSDGRQDADSSVQFVDKQPLYLQHQGHSRTVVGIEFAREETYLLAFDPDADIDTDAAGMAQVSKFRLSQDAISRHEQYQVLYAESTVDTSRTDIQKSISSLRVP